MNTKIGLDGLIYGVFKTTYEAWNYAEKHDLQIACFGGYENAVLLQDTFGQ